MEINLCFGCMEETTSNPCPHCGYDGRVHSHQDYTLRPGTILYGKYLVGKVLGQGGFGITYIGWDLALSRKVAIKEYFPSSHVTRDSGACSALQWYITEQAREAQNKGREMFLKEARKMNRVSSIHQVVQVLDLFEDNETAYIIMDFIQGEDLMHRIERSGPLPWETVKELLLPVADTMQQVHDAGLIHRDLSPDNLMILPNGSVKILDLGASKDMKLNTGASSMQVAKCGFSPLEQYVQSGSSGSWTDVYSLAATMYYAITGIVPPSAVDRIETDSLRWDLPQLRKIPTAVIDVLKWGMALHANERIQTMDAFADKIRRAIYNKKHRILFAGKILAALIPIVLLGALGIGMLVQRDGKPDGEEPKHHQLSAQDSTQAATQAPEQENVLVDESEVPWGGNVLMAPAIPEEYAFNMDEAPVFNSRIARYQIVSVTFLDSVENAGSDSWDISQNRDGSVLAWTKPNGTVSIWKNSEYVEETSYDLFIAADGGINGKYCSKLFSGFQNLKSVSFNGCFHTDYAESMEDMFYSCYALEELDVRELETGRVCNMQNMFRCCDVRELDVSGFDTSNVTDMSGMFNTCSNLTVLDLSNFDTSKVTDMGDMFGLCSGLTDLDISSFDTSNVRDMSFMFTYIDLTELDLTHFNTSKVTTMAYMFSGSDQLVSLDLRNFDTSCVDSMSGMFESCKKLREILGIEQWDTSNVSRYDSFMDEGVQIDGAPWETIFQ